MRFELTPEDRAINHRIHQRAGYWSPHSRSYITYGIRDSRKAVERLTAYWWDGETDKRHYLVEDNPNPEWEK